MTTASPFAAAEVAPTKQSGAADILAIYAGGAAIVIASFLAYHNTFSLPFVFDDQLAVVDNPTIRHLWPLTDVLRTPLDGSGVAGRPLLNLSFALNYALSGLNVRSYHAVNLLLHTASALFLFAIVRRTLLQPVLRERFGAAALPIAVTSAIVWAVHPLNTESVTCIAQRTELLVAFFYLLALLGLVRAAEHQASRRWPAIAFGACLLGMASKEVMATMPVLALLYDRTFLAGTFREAWRLRRGLYFALGSTWLLLGWIVLSMGGSRGDAAGFGLGVSAWSYALKQCEAIIHYLWLAIWPHPLVIDYGTDVVHSAAHVWPQGLMLLALLGATAFALVRRPVLGFLGAWFFIILAPSSSFIPLVAQTMAEHRTYLPLASVVVLGVAGLQASFGRWITRGWIVPVAALTIVAAQRNTVYRSELSLWRDTAASRPDNPRAHLCLGVILMNTGRADEAEDEFWEVLRLDPTHTTAHNNMGRLLAARGAFDEALQHYDLALEGTVDRPEILSNACDALRRLGRLEDAIQRGEEALRLKPDLAVAHANLGLVLADLRRDAEAIPHYEAALRLRPDFAGTRNNLGVALMNTGRLTEARTQLETALQAAPQMAAAHNTLGAVLDHLGDRDAAAKHFEAALRIDPRFADAQRNLESVRNASKQAGSLN